MGDVAGFSGSRSPSESFDFKLVATSTWSLESTHCDNQFAKDLHEFNNNRKTASITELKRCELTWWFSMKHDWVTAEPCMKRIITSSEKVNNEATV